METSWVHGPLCSWRGCPRSQLRWLLPSQRQPFPFPAHPDPIRSDGALGSGLEEVACLLKLGSPACWPVFSRAHALALWEELRPLWLVHVSEATCVWKPLGQALLALQEEIIIIIFFNYLFTFPLADSLGAPSERGSTLGAGPVPMAFAQGEG